MEKSEEADLVERAGGGDRSAFGSLVRLRQERIYMLALQMLGSPSEAEDAVQETMLRAWRAIGRFDRRSELATWLYRIGINVCLNALRKRGRSPSRELDAPEAAEPADDPDRSLRDPGRAVETANLQRRVAAAVERLSPSLRATVALVLMQGLSHQETAAALGCSEGTIAWRVHEARRRLRAQLRDVLDDPQVGSPRVRL